MSSTSFEDVIFCLTTWIEEWHHFRRLIQLFRGCRRDVLHVHHMRANTTRIECGTQGAASIGTTYILLLCERKVGTKYAHDERGKCQEGEYVQPVLFLHTLRISSKLEQIFTLYSSTLQHFINQWDRDYVLSSYGTPPFRLKTRAGT